MLGAVSVSVDLLRFHRHTGEFCGFLFDRADEHCTIAHDAAAVGTGLVAGDKDLGGPHCFVPVSYAGVGAQTHQELGGCSAALGDGQLPNVDLTVLCTVSAITLAGVLAAVPIGAAAAQHGIGDIAAVSTEEIVGAVVQKIIVLQRRLVLPLVGSVGAVLFIALSLVAEAGQTVGGGNRHITGGTAAYASSQALSGIIGNQQILNFHGSALADKHTAAAPVNSGSCFIVGDIPAGDLALAAADTNPAAFAVAVCVAAGIAPGGVAGDNPAGHQKIVSIDPSACVGFVPGDLSALHLQESTAAGVDSAAPIFGNILSDEGAVPDGHRITAAVCADTASAGIQRRVAGDHGFTADDDIAGAAFRPDSAANTGLVAGNHAASDVQTAVSQTDAAAPTVVIIEITFSVLSDDAAGHGQTAIPDEDAASIGVSIGSRSTMNDRASLHEDRAALINKNTPGKPFFMAIDDTILHNQLSAVHSDNGG